MSGGYEIELRQQTTSNTFQYLNENSELYDLIESLLAENKSRLILGIDEFDKIGRKLSHLVLTNPLLFLAACEEGYQKVFEGVYNARASVQLTRPLHTPHLGVRDWLGSHTVTPRGLCSRLVNRFVCVEGIATRCSLVRSKLSRSVHVCEENGFTVTREHYDTSSLQRDYQLVTRGVPKTDKEGNPLHIEVALCGFKDSQMITLQEMPESAPTGQLPRSVDVSFEDDLVDSVKPGDRVRVFGIYRAVAWKKGTQFSGLSKAFIIGNNVEQLKHDALSPDISPSDLRTMREIAARSDTFELLSQSIAPSICGHDLVKKGLLLQLLGGERKELENGMKIRGDIHILLIGDPSCGKSQLLRFIMNSCPLALSTTGRGSSGVGLTAAVVSDKDSGERRLEAGAMVLADGGLVCIDEFDKMSSEDRVAIHEVMEQQTVTISKAGIQTSLNARTSVLAAANPVYGSFDPNAPLKSQITFPDSLLTRFDLIYIIRDAQSCEADRRICSQVIRQLQHRPASGVPLGRHTTTTDEEWGVLQPVVNHSKKQGEARYWESSVIPSSTVGSQLKVRHILSVEFLQKYIHYVRNARRSPVLGDDAMDSIAKFYSELRQMFAGHDGKGRAEGRVIPTARTLEACVRLATAHAKLKLKTTVDLDDALEAQKLLLYTLTGQAPQGYTKDGMREEEIDSIKPNSVLHPDINKKRSRINFNESKRADSAKKQLMEDDQGIHLTKTNLISQNSSLIPSVIEKPLNERDEIGSQGSIDSMEEFGDHHIIITAKRLKVLTRYLGQVQSSVSSDSIAPKDLIELVNQHVTGKLFSWPEFFSGLRQLQSENKIMLVNDEVWFI